jgi:hypothetical protein
MTIVGDGTVIWCNASGCQGHLTIPPALVDQPAENQRRWAAGEHWTADLGNGLDWCARHPQSPQARRAH